MSKPATKVCSACGNDLPLDSFGPRARGRYGRKSQCAPCLAEKERKRREADPEGARLRARQWEHAHPKTVEQMESARVRARAWYRSNKRRHQGNSRAWVLAHPERFKAIQRRYQIKSPVHVRRKAHMSMVTQDLTPTQWAEILETFGYRCAYCLAPVRLTMDHLIPVSKGGPHTADNVVPACRKCNSAKGDRPIFTMLNREVAHEQAC